MSTRTHNPSLTREHGVSWRDVVGAPVTAVVVVWLSAAAMSVFAPDMITGSNQEHIPIALFSVWVWAAVATAYCLMATRATRSAPTLVVGVSALWISVLVAVVAAPVMVTGSDPTQIPLAVFVAPVVGAITTGLIGLAHATAARSVD